MSVLIKALSKKIDEVIFHIVEEKNYVDNEIAWDEDLSYGLGKALRKAREIKKLLLGASNDLGG